MESGYNKISEPHHLDRLKMLIASVRDGQARSRCRNTSRTRNLRQGKASTTSAILSETAPEETGTCPNAHTAQPKKNPPTPWFPPYDRNYMPHPHFIISESMFDFQLFIQRVHRPTAPYTTCNNTLSSASVPHAFRPP